MSTLNNRPYFSMRTADVIALASGGDPYAREELTHRNPTRVARAETRMGVKVNAPATDLLTQLVGLLTQATTPQVVTQVAPAPERKPRKSRAERNADQAAAYGVTVEQLQAVKREAEIAADNDSDWRKTGKNGPAWWATYRQTFAELIVEEKNEPGSVAGDMGDIFASAVCDAIEAGHGPVKIESGNDVSFS